MMTLVIHFHQSAYRDFKHYYQNYVAVQLQSAFPKLISYGRFVGRIDETLGPLCVYLMSWRDTPSGLAFVDATSLAVCNNRRIHCHRAFEGLAGRGKTSIGWFYGFKLHVIVNDRGGLLAFMLTAGNIDDRTPLLQLGQGLHGCATTASLDALDIALWQTMSIAMGKRNGAVGAKIQSANELGRGEVADFADSNPLTCKYRGYP